ncbi:DUF262 domain-containing protein [Macrococcus bovicus]|uniref:DUF262 domain-containing protein n=2 Tax=Macrococcus bovicus TaxID=69968 RepID=A0A4R6C184_9STAP|nr:DUF262 domain-containing protein [Macrococcus bovicus]
MGREIMNITPETKPISEIFSIESKTVYKIPFYQRNYSWQTQNIEDLFNDVNEEIKGYYIGNLLVSKKNVENNVTTFDVVDGQQRLTTIALFFLAIYEKLDEIKNKLTLQLKEPTSGNSNEISELASIINLQNDIKRKLIFELNNKPKLELLDKDAEVYNNYLGILNQKEKSKFGNRLFGKRYNFVKNLFDDIDCYDKIFEFYDKLNSIEILRITVDDLTDAFTVFSSLNAKGLPLTLIDLLKSNYLSVAVSEITQEDAMKEWNSLINIFTDQNQNSNSGVITQFLLNNYDTFESDKNVSITKSLALRKYEEVFNKKKFKYMDELIENAKIYSFISPQLENYDNFIEDDEIVSKLIKLAKLESSQVFPLELFILKKFNQNLLTRETVLNILDYLIKYYVRRNLVLKPKASNIRAKVIDIIRELEFSSQINQIAESITQRNLNKIISSEQEFYNALTGSVYDISPSTVRYILIDIERRKGNYFHKQNPDNLDSYIESNKGKKQLIWTLEHILPQGENLSSEWSNMISPNNVDNASQIQSEYTHKLGNLTLTGYNSEMSNDDFIKKRDYKPSETVDYTGLRTKLFINESIVDSEIDETIDLKESWTIKDIKRRTEVLARIAMDLYKI